MNPAQTVPVQEFDDLERVEEEVRFLEELKRLKNAFGLPFYQPHAKQAAFHNAALEYNYRLFKAGNRTGKSQAGAAENAAWLFGERVWLPADHPARKGGIPQREVKGVVISVDWDKINENFTGDGSGTGRHVGLMWRLLPTDGFVVKTHRNSLGVIDQIWCANGSVLFFDTASSFAKNKMAMESSSWDFAHFDEPVEKDLFTAIARGGIDRGFSAWFTLTPLNQLWINDFFFPDALGSEFKNFRGKRFVVEATTYDNPFLSRQSIEEFESMLTPEERECRIYGRPMELSGLVYKQFSIEKHVLKKVPAGWESYTNPPLDYTIYVAIDPHPQTPHAVLFVAVSPEGYCFIYDEIFARLTKEQLSSEIHKRLENRNLATIKCDPWAWNRDPITETCFAEELIYLGLPVEKASKEKSHGILHMQNAFAREDYVFVSPTCTRFLYEIQRYVFNKENRPIDKDDHMMENMYRLFINEPCYFPPYDSYSFKLKPYEIRGGAAARSLSSLAFR